MWTARDRTGFSGLTRVLRSAPGGVTSASTSAWRPGCHAARRWRGRRAASSTLLALFLACTLTGARVGAADGTDDVQDASDPGDVRSGTEELSDEFIIIEDSEEDAEAATGGDAPREDVPAPPVATSWAARLWEAWHVGADSQGSAQLQGVAPEDGPWRLWAGLSINSWLIPAPGWSLYANGFGRLFLDSAPEAQLETFADLYEAYAQINLGGGSVQVGRLVLPWAKSGAVALGDRLNPPDYRRGPGFLDPVAGKQPQYGAVLRTSVGALGVEAVVLGAYEPSEGSLAASNQGGVRIARYQGALLRSPARVSGQGGFHDRSSLLASGSFWEETVLAGRARQRIADLDVGVSVVYGLDELPSLSLAPEIASALASEAYRAWGVPTPATSGLCAGASDAPACFGGVGALRHERATSLSADVAWGLGIVIVRAEAVAYPRVAALRGKTALLVDEQSGMTSTALGQYGLALAAEGALGEWVSGSLELFDLMWQGVPAGALLWGVERFDADRSRSRWVHRFAAAANMHGTLAGERLRWTVRGEAGVLQRDLLATAELRYRLPVLDLYVGSEGSLFVGDAGSPGWLRQDASMWRLFVGEGS